MKVHWREVHVRRINIRNQIPRRRIGKVDCKLLSRYDTHSSSVLSSIFIFIFFVNFPEPPFNQRTYVCFREPLADTVYSASRTSRSNNLIYIGTATPRGVGALTGKSLCARALSLCGYASLPDGCQVTRERWEDRLKSIWAYMSSCYCCSSSSSLWLLGYSLCVGVSSMRCWTMWNVLYIYIVIQLCGAYQLVRNTNTCMCVV